jgi:tRNA G46 methylase TrmB
MTAEIAAEHYLRETALQANSSPISSRQTGIHDQLEHLLARHANTQFLKPIAPYSRTAFDSGVAVWAKAGYPPLILDAGCGVGLSTLHLATRFPDHFVMGVDQSADRLSRNTAWPGAMPDNFVLLRADLVDFWRLMHAARIYPVRHYLLYPNPWPKIGHLARRWHGHAVFPTILALGGVLECRSNWRIYIEEFAFAAARFTQMDIACEAYEPQSPITPFEQKYLASGHALWRCQFSLSSSPAVARFSGQPHR